MCFLFKGGVNGTGTVLINLSEFLPCRRVYTAEQSMHSGKTIPDMEVSAPQNTMSVPDPADLHNSSDSGEQINTLFGEQFILGYVNIHLPPVLIFTSCYLRYNPLKS